LAGFAGVGVGGHGGAGACQTKLNLLFARQREVVGQVFVICRGQGPADLALSL